MSEKLSLAAKIAKAAMMVGGRLKADKTNMQDRYSYISADKILAECGQALAECGVVVFPAIIDHGFELGQTAGGKPRIDAWVKFAFSISDGESSLEYPWIGRGTDYSTPDKALYKAITSGHKYFVAKMLMVGEGNEDGENEQPTQEAPPVRPAQPQPARRPPPADNPFIEAPATQEAPADNLITDKQLRMLHALGVQVYGDSWSDKRKELVLAITRGEHASAADLTVKQASRLIDGLKTKVPVVPAPAELVAVEPLAF